MIRIKIRGETFLNAKDLSPNTPHTKDHDAIKVHLPFGLFWSKRDSKIETSCTDSRRTVVSSTAASAASSGSGFGKPIATRTRTMATKHACKTEAYNHTLPMHTIIRINAYATQSEIAHDRTKSKFRRKRGERNVANSGR